MSKVKTLILKKQKTENSGCAKFVLPIPNNI